VKKRKKKEKKKKRKEKKKKGRRRVRVCVGLGSLLPEFPWLLQESSYDCTIVGSIGSHPSPLSPQSFSLYNR
jgi:hypothetical protein